MKKNKILNNCSEDGFKNNIEKEMQKYKTVMDHKSYYLGIHDLIKNNQFEKKQARIKKGIYKDLMEEFYPLIKYVELRYENDMNITFKWTGKILENQGINYDGIILKNGEIYEKIEMTFPKLGNKEVLQAKILNEEGVVSEVGSLDEEMRYLEKVIIETFDKKNTSKHYDDSIVLVIYIENRSCIFRNVPECEKMFDNVRNHIKKESYIFKEVYLLTDNDDFEKKIEKI